MTRRLRFTLIAASALGVSGLAFAEPAAAAPAIGEDVRDLITGLAGPIVFSIGGLTALSAFMRRDVGVAFTTVVITLIVGLFVTDVGRDALESITDLIGKALNNKNG